MKAKKTRKNKTKMSEFLKLPKNRKCQNFQEIENSIIARNAKNAKKPKVSK